MELSGKTKVVILIGNPVEHSMSPKMHTSAFKEIGIDAIYIATKVENKRVKAAVESIRALNFLGANVTIPHKVAVMKFVDELDPIAKDIGAVNTIVNKEGKLYATNTDGLGFMRSMREAGIKLEGMN
ncbi:MAG: shikimate dehydrogenase family protein, partial [Candidatus Hodarchaeota archaeon]